MKLMLCVVLGFAVLSANAVDSLACNSRDAVKDHQGAVVKDSNGKCVRTKWLATSDQCALRAWLW